jgi:Lrp/AsnC family leucine-responsive transcriptional regulator
MLDALDRAILAHLQRDGRLTNAELAERIRLSPSPTLRRVRRLETEGYIRAYAALLDAARLGRGTVVFARVRLERQTREAIEAFEAAVAALPEVLECHSVLGDTDYVLRIAAASLDDYRQWYMEHLAPLPGVATIESQVAFRTVKSTTALPLEGPGAGDPSASR